jgi:hypothetical protein
MAHAGQRAVACVRARDWRLLDGEGSVGGVAGRVEWVERGGHGAVVHVAIGSTVVRALCGEQAPGEGEDVGLRPDAERVLLFDPATGRALGS